MLKQVLQFVRQAFSDNGQPSSSRLLTAYSVGFVSLGWLHVCFHTHQLPDGAATAGAATLATAPYALNSASNAVAAWKAKRDADKEATGTDSPASK